MLSLGMWCFWKLWLIQSDSTVAALLSYLRLPKCFLVYRLGKRTKDCSVKFEGVNLLRASSGIYSRDRLVLWIWSRAGSSPSIIIPQSSVYSQSLEVNCPWRHWMLFSGTQPSIPDALPKQHGTKPIFQKWWQACNCSLLIFNNHWVDKVELFNPRI